MSTTRHILRKLRRNMKRPDQESRAWIRGYTIAVKLGYKAIRDCRIIAMAYSMGWINGRKTRCEPKPFLGAMDRPHEG